jgi:type II secretory pathway pseudopilin PulG
MKARPSSNRRARAFTLLEVMLALGILMMVLAVIYSTWMAILRSKIAADKAALNAQRSRITVRALEDALEGVQVFQQNQPYYAFLADTSGDYAFLSVASRLPQSFPGSGLFGDQTLRRVTFQVENGTNGKPELVMRQYPLLLATNAVEEAYPIVLATEVTDFLLEFWDARRGEWLPEWTFTNQLPPVVRFLIGVGQSGNDPSMPQAVQVQTVALSATPVPFELQGRPMGRPPPQGTNAPPPDGEQPPPQGEPPQ